MQICSPMLVPWLISLTGFASLWNTVKSAESNNFRKQATFMDNRLDFSDLVNPFDTVRNTVEFHHDIVNKSPNHLTLLWKRKQFISNNLVVERAKAFLFDPKKNRFLSPKVIIRDGQGSVRHNSFPNFSRRKKSRSMFSLRIDHFKTQRKRKYMGDDSSSEDLYPDLKRRNRFPISYQGEIRVGPKPESGDEKLNIHNIIGKGSTISAAAMKILTGVDPVRFYPARQQVFT